MNVWDRTGRYPRGVSSAAPDAAPVPTPESGWLAADEQEAWKNIVALLLLLPGPLDAQLQRTSGIGLFEYLVLSAMSHEPDHTLRMSELARLTNGSLSRLSNVVKRLEQRGWVTRAPDPTDGRYTVAALTDQGWDLVVAAAPGHVDAVRRLVIDPLTAADVQALITAGRRILDRLPGGPDHGDARTGPGPACPGAPC